MWKRRYSGSVRRRFHSVMNGPVKNAAMTVNTPMGPPAKTAMTVTAMSCVMRQAVNENGRRWEAMGATASMGATPMRVFRYSDTPNVNSSVPTTQRGGGEHQVARERQKVERPR